MSKTLKPWRLSLAHLTVDEADPFELIEAATAAGFDLHRAARHPGGRSTGSHPPGR